MRGPQLIDGARKLLAYRNTSVQCLKRGPSSRQLFGILFDRVGPQLLQREALADVVHGMGSP